MFTSKPYGISYAVGDIITVHLNLDNRTLGFSRNNDYLGIAFNTYYQDNIISFSHNC